MSQIKEMPLYVSHKKVRALEIESLNYDRGTGNYFVQPIDSTYPPIEIKPEVLTRYKPNRGDFLVQYEDGYMSISPRKAFLDGYTLADAAPVAGAEASEATVHPSFHPNIVVSARSLVLDRNGRGWWLFPDSMTIIPAEPR